MTEEQFAGWLEAYGRAWKEGDASAVTTLFSPNAVYYEVPFDPPMVGQAVITDYWQAGAGLSQQDVTFGFTVIAVHGATGLNHWTAEFTRVPSGVRVRLDGIMVSRFDASGRCVEFREWWHRQETPDD